MFRISRLFSVILIAFIAASLLVTVVTSEELTRAENEDLSNAIEKEESAEIPAKINSDRKKEIESDSEESESQDNDIVAVQKDNTEGEETVSLEKQYDIAVEWYLDDNWEKCIENFEKAAKSYKNYRANLVGCRKKCREESNAAKPIFDEDLDDFHFYEKKVRETLCLMKCKKTISDEDIKAKIVPTDVEEKYIERRPYEYLHICYYQMKRHQDAANAIFTFLVYHPKHEQSLKNLRFYIDLPDVNEDEIIDLEADPYLLMYKAGIMAYDDENYPEVIEHLENSIKAYMRAENDCRLFCEGPFDQGWHPDFVMSIANHFAFAMRCKRSCAHWLNNVNGEQRRNVLLDHYHYLQFAYFQVGKLKEACAAVESYLYSRPDDETVLKNKKYFLGLPGVEKEFFVPREEAVSYINRQEYELRIQQYIQEEFRAVTNSSDS